MASFSEHVDFTAESAPYVQTGYHADIGREYGDRNKGRIYGWSESNELYARSPGASTTAFDPQETFNHLRDGQTWSIAVPNGTYTVRIVAGDPKHIDSHYQIYAEKIRVVDGEPTAANPYVESTKSITVTDGKLTLVGVSGGNNKLALVEITSEDVTPPPPPVELPTVSFTDNEAVATEASNNDGAWIVTRTGGDISQPLTVKYAIGGSATNGNDYDKLSGVITIEAGKTSATIVIDPKDDSIHESTETVTATLASGGYTLGKVTVATATITDNDAADGVTPSISWSNAPNAPSGRVEPEVVQVGDKMFVMGGFDGDLNVNRRNDIFNLETQTWSSGAQLPEGAARTHGGMVSDGQYIYLISGQYEKGYGRSTTRSYRYDIEKDSWIQWISLPVKRYGGATVYQDGEIYYFGGAKEDRHTVSNSYYMINVKDSKPTWKYMGEMPLSGDHVGHAEIDGKIYIIGGEHGHEGLNADPAGTYIQHKYLLEYNPDTDQFTRKADMLQAASHFEAATHVLGGKIVIFGGNDKYESQTNKIQMYDPSTNKWTYLSQSVPDPRQGPASAIWDGKIYYANGYSHTLGVTTKAYWGTLNDF